MDAAIQEQQQKDREEFASLPKSMNKPISWCNEHDCKMTTCFALHNPESISLTATPVDWNRKSNIFINKKED